MIQGSIKDTQIEAALVATGNNVAAAARELGCSPKTIYVRRSKPGYPRPDVPEPDHVQPVHVGLSGLVDAVVVFGEGQP